RASAQRAGTGPPRRPPRQHQRPPGPTIRPPPSVRVSCSLPSSSSCHGSLTFPAATALPYHRENPARMRDLERCEPSRAPHPGPQGKGDPPRPPAPSARPAVPSPANVTSATLAATPGGQRLPDAAPAAPREVLSWLRQPSHSSVMVAPTRTNAV